MERGTKSGNRDWGTGDALRLDGLLAPDLAFPSAGNARPRVFSSPTPNPAFCTPLHQAAQTAQHRSKVPPTITSCT